jgi:hypothetical protein
LATNVCKHTLIKTSIVNGKIKTACYDCEKQVRKIPEGKKNNIYIGSKYMFTQIGEIEDLIEVSTKFNIPVFVFKNSRGEKIPGRFVYRKVVVAPNNYCYYLTEV